MTVLRGVRVTHWFGAATVLSGVDVAVAAGEVLAVTGPSGSGKSTLLHCLAGILRPAEGEVWLGGDRIDGWSEARRTALRGARLGFVFQFGQLLPELPAVENVALPLLLGGTRRAEAVARAAAWFGPLGLDGLQDRRPAQLSGGQEQRVAIARALVTSPEVVFADEPTGALDTATGARITALLRDVAARTGTAVVVVTHDAEVAGACHRTLTLRDGRVLPPGPPGGGPPAATALRPGGVPAAPGGWYG